MKQSPFAIVPMEVCMDDRLTKMQLRVLLAILTWRDRDTNLSNPTRDQLSERCGYNATTISRVTSDLVKLGWLEKVGKGGRSAPCKYRFRVPETVTEPETVSEVKTVSEPDTKTVPEPVTGNIQTSTDQYPPAPRGGREGVNGESKRKERERKTAELKAEFAEHVWPERWRRPNENRHEAEAAYLARRRAGVPMADLVHGVQRYRRFVEQGGVSSPRYAKAVETFLGPARHWEQPWEVAGRVPEDRYEILELAERHGIELGDMRLDQARRELARATGMTL